MIEPSRRQVRFMLPTSERRKARGRSRRICCESAGDPEGMRWTINIRRFEGCSI